MPESQDFPGGAGLPGAEIGETASMRHLLSAQPCLSALSAQPLDDLNESARRAFKAPRAFFCLRRSLSSERPQADEVGGQRDGEAQRHDEGEVFP